MKVHRDSDLRTCGALTTVINQSSVFVEDKLIAVNGDPNTHLEGQLISTVGSTIFAEDKLIIVEGDVAAPDLLCPIIGGNHCFPYPSSFSSTVNAY